jgi:hypothetical protein
MLLAVQQRDAKPDGMLYLLLLALTPNPTPPLPKPFTQVHQRDIDCIAAIAILSDEQTRGVQSAVKFPPVGLDGPKWSGIMGERIMFETGQPKEVVAFAMREAVRARRSAPRTDVTQAAANIRLNECMAQMKLEIEKDAALK